MKNELVLDDKSKKEKLQYVAPQVKEDIEFSSYTMACKYAAGACDSINPPVFDAS